MKLGRVVPNLEMAVAMVGIIFQLVNVAYIFLLLISSVANIPLHSSLNFIFFSSDHLLNIWLLVAIVQENDCR